MEFGVQGDSRALRPGVSASGSVHGLAVLGWGGGGGGGFEGFRRLRLWGL